MTKPRILLFDETPSVDRGGGISTKPLAGASIGTQGFTSGITSFPSGAAIRLHTHNVEEAVTILEGEAQVDVEGQSFRVKRLDTSYIPAGIPHRFINVGDGIMRILWVYSTTHVTRTYVDTGETVEHLSGGDLAGGKPAGSGR